MKKTTFILAYILTLILGLSAARGQGVTKDAKGNYIQMSSQKATESTAKPTGQTFTDKTGKVYPVMVSKNGKLFVVRVSKNGKTTKSNKQKESAAKTDQKRRKRYHVSILISRVLSFLE